ncbi:MAG TPA: radical SAM protein [Candidatus Scatomorpha merdipullorum]|uniref:Radical SAM protein n=1 Tax=Candidatus Scatomorpha merdipullorum TaxID=2840927 RepID=A0A9D1FDM6_9FIRM|nr:radical SAM protein [Candidatus Scatomorpha merdipullorum]
MSARESIIPVFVPHLGCPNDCVFCNQRRISGSLSPARPEDVAAAIDRALSLTPPGTRCQLAFYGGSFTAIPDAEQEALLGAAQPYLERGDIASIRLSTRPDAIDGAVLARLKRHGVETVELGAQSMSDSVLALSGRGHTAADVEEASRAVKAAGFRLILQMMTGLPGSDDETDIGSARSIAALEPDGVRVYPTVIVRDTALFDLWRAGRYKEHTVEDAVRVCARIVPVFEAAGIPIIRMGLNPTEDLSGGDAVGGAYHPALGELVRARIMRGRAEALLEGSAPGADITLRVNPRLMSQLVGQHGANRAYLTEKFALKRLKILPDAAVEGVELG